MNNNQSHLERREIVNELPNQAKLTKSLLAKERKRKKKKKKEKKK